MKSPRVALRRFVYFMRVLSRIFNLRSLLGPQRIAKDRPLNPDIIFAASTADFQKSTDGFVIPDKFDLWRRETLALGLSSKVVIMPFSRTPGRPIPKDSLLIESYAIGPQVRNWTLRSLVNSVRKLRIDLGSLQVPLSTYLNSRIWSNFLTKTKPKLLVGIGLTDEVLSICKHLGIGTFEVQHGIFGEGELQHWWSYSADGTSCGPDLFLTWDEHYSGIASRLNIQALTVGYPHHFLERSSFLSNGGEEAKPSKPMIVVTLACRLPHGIDPWGIVDRNMDKAIRNLLERNFSVRLRLHPVAEGGKLHRIRISRWLMNRFPGAEIAFPSRESILSTLKEAAIHLTIASSTVLEASYLGVHSLILEGYYQELDSSHNVNEALNWLPPELLSTGLVRPTNTENLIADIAQLIDLPPLQYANPLDFQALQARIMKSMQP